MNLTIYQVDAFADKLFSGNPAAIVPLEKWLDAELMQQIAMENNLSETAFFVPSGEKEIDFDIRWFTPGAEINLCGHATLASAYVAFNCLGHRKYNIVFNCKSGLLNITRDGDFIVMDFPSWKPGRVSDYPEALPTILGDVEIVGVYKHRDLLVELMDETAVRNCRPDLSLMKKHFDKLIITAPGSVHRNGGSIEQVDFVCRFCAPGAGVDEDPVTGSAHSQLIPFWSEKLSKKKMYALQLSPRGGQLWCEQLSETRVSMKGKAVFYMKGEIYL